MTSINAVKASVETEITKGLQKAADSPNIPMGNAAVNAASDIVAKKVNPIINHLTNNEPWYQSRVTWGSIVAIAAPIIAPLISRIVGATVTIDASEQAAIAEWLALVGSAAGGLFALYGRWKATKPLGS